MADKVIGLLEKVKNIYRKRSLQFILSLSFTLVAVAVMIGVAAGFSQRFVKSTERLAIINNKNVLDQMNLNLDTYLHNMMSISNTMYYSIIKNTDFGKDSMEHVSDQMKLLYDANASSLVSVAIFSDDGDLIAAQPLSRTKPNADPVSEDWFTKANEQIENVHFSAPHVENLFVNSDNIYHWVVSLSRAVELTSNGTSTLGVLLVDMNYNSIEQILKKANVGNSSEYVYLIDGKGEIIYHPRQKLIYTDLYQENNIEAAGYEDGSTEEIFQGEKRLVTVKTVSYTGWKIVSVVPMSSFDMGMTGTKYFVIMLVTVSMLAVILLNQLVSASIAMPLKKLNNSVKEWETGNMNPSIYIGGSMEVEHLGCTLRSTVEQIRQLMQDIVVEQEEKRKSELDALQSQINPHFLYNTLDSIVWMIEGERYEDAVFMITQLASLFRISLSRGKTVISVEDELKHARNYMNIQKVRYKNIFEVRFDIDPEILQCCTVKLVVQPLLENAIYYGVECMDGDGEIDVNGYRREDDIYIEVRDNGLGIPEDEVEQLLKENNRVHKRGSGVGLLNVHNRIRLRFGEEYGLEIESEPDEGTTVRIHLPYIVYTPEEQERLESGRKQL